MPGTAWRWHSKPTPARLGVNYIDLFLIHWPGPAQDRYGEAFLGLEVLLREGKVWAIGTSNFKPSHLQRLFTAGLTPHVNQLQLDPDHVRTKVQALHNEKRTITGASTGMRGYSWVGSCPSPSLGEERNGEMVIRGGQSERLTDGHMRTGSFRTSDC